jgi:hypothetical protein
MKAIEKHPYRVLRVSYDMFTEQDQKTIRERIPNVTSVEMARTKMVINTRSSRLHLAVGDWIVIDSNNRIKTFTHEAFQENFELIEQ